MPHGSIWNIYGDPRFVADTITQDIVRFRPSRDGEYARFCDLVHLVRRSFNTLSEVGRENDMDNNHMFRRPQSLVTFLRDHKMSRWKR